MYCKRAALATVVITVFTACNHQPAKPAIARIAILRFENVGADASVDWMGRAFSEIISTELTPVNGVSVVSTSQMHSLERQTGVRPVSSPGISSERSLAIFSGANRLGYGDYFLRGGRLHARVTVEDPATGRMTGVYTAESAADDVAGAASKLALQIAPGAGKYATSNASAIEAYVTAAEAGQPAAMIDGASRAVAADPNFAPAWRLLASAKAREQDRDGALAVLAEAAKHGNAMAPGERARIALETATLRGDQAGRRKAMLDLAKAEPTDLEVWRSLAELSYALRDYPGAVSAWEKTLALEPDNTASLNSAAYAYAYAGNLDGALATLRRYRTLNPDDANALDTTGDVYLIAGRLGEAENFYMQANKLNPALQGGSDLHKAAMARLMTGDVAGADGLEKQLEDARAAAKDPGAPYRQAEWAWIAGRRKQAYGQLAAFAESAENGPLKEMASRAYSQLALWSLLMEDRDGAANMVRKAIQFAGPASGPTAALMRFLVQPVPGQSPSGGLFLAYSYLLNKQFDQASAELQRVYDNPANANDESIPVLLAWARVETGREGDAAALLRTNPVPPLGGPGLFTCLYFPRLYDLRARVAEKQGRREEAQAARQLYQKLGGT